MSAHREDDDALAAAIGILNALGIAGALWIAALVVALIVL